MPIRTRRRALGRALIAWGAVALWMLLIFVLSSQPGGPETGSGRLRFGLDKFGHLVVFGNLGVLVANALATQGVGRTRFWWTFVICALYAVTDELHQVLVPGRSPTVYDILIDVAGASAGFALHRIVTTSSRLQGIAVGTDRDRPVRRSPPQSNQVNGLDSR